MRHPCYFRKKRKSLNFLNSNSNSNFASIHVDFRKKQKFKIFKFEFKLPRIAEDETKNTGQTEGASFSKREAQVEGEGHEAEAVENDI